MNCKAIPDYAVIQKGIYFLLGIDESFSYLNKDMYFLMWKEEV